MGSANVKEHLIHILGGGIEKEWVSKIKDFCQSHLGFYPYQSNCFFYEQNAKGHVQNAKIRPHSAQLAEGITEALNITAHAYQATTTMGILTIVYVNNLKFFVFV